MVDVALIRGLEQRGFNAWPASRTLLLDGVVVRLSGGYTRRANSFTPLWPSRARPADLAGPIAAHFLAAGLPPVARLTPCADPAWEQALAGMGWREDDPARVMLRRGLPGGLAPAAEISPRATPEWLDGAGAANGLDGTSRAALAAMMERIAPEAAFATLRESGAPVAFGLGVLELGLLGLFDLVVPAPMRGRGFGARLVAALMGWARERGGEGAFLQVREANEGASRLYRRLGFSDVYRYTHRIG